MAAYDNPVQLLADLVRALDGSFISSWQSTAGWVKELDAAREYLNKQHPITDTKE